MNTFPSPHAKDSEGSTGLVFLRVYNKWHTEIKKQLKTVGITHPQFVVLTTLGYLSQFHKEITQVMIANMAGMDVMSLSQILVLLVKRGYIKKRQHSADTRANAISLTDSGQAVMLSVLPIVEQVDQMFFGSLENEESAFRTYLSKLSNYKFLDE